MSYSVEWWLVTDVSGQSIGPTLKMRPIGFPKRRVVNYQYKACNIAEERRDQSLLFCAAVCERIWPRIWAYSLYMLSGGKFRAVSVEV